MAIRHNTRKSLNGNTYVKLGICSFTPLTQGAGGVHPAARSVGEMQAIESKAGVLSGRQNHKVWMAVKS